MKILLVLPLSTLMFSKSMRNSLLIPLAAAAFAVNGPAYAIDDFIAKTIRPDIINVTSNGGTGLAQFSVISTDFPSGTLGDPKKLQAIEWITTSYPQNLDEIVELCYQRPFNSNQTDCREIQPNSSGTFTEFNEQTFGNGSRVIIRHKVSAGGAQVGHPAGNDSVTFRYSY